MGKIIGIDLGTTNSVMAILDKKDKNQPKTVENTDGKRLMPSVVGIDEYGERFVGELAKTQAVLYPENTIFSVKRFMGRNFRDPDIQRDIQMVPYKITESSNGEVEVWLRGKAYSPPEISAMILKALKQEAEEQIGEVTHAVITVPAYFGQRQKDATREAGRLAGIKVLRVIPEPTAAALAYGISTQASEPKTLLIYDLGGGTFDITILLVSGGNFVNVAVKGDNHLGGDDFDQAVVNHIIGDTQRRYGVNLLDNREALQKLKHAAEQAKIQLTKRQKVPIAIPHIAKDSVGRSVDIQLELTREEYEAMIRPHIKRTIDLTLEAIREADYRPEDLDHILLVGGSSLTPLVAELLRKEFGEEKILRGINPMECVALGAAIQTGIPVPIICPNCKTLNEGDFEKCQGCGALLEESAEQPETECPECGRPNRVGRSECWHCSAQIGITVDGQPVGVLEQTPKPIGIQTEGDKMDVIIPKGTYYPTPDPITRHFYTTQLNQTILRAPVYEGFDETASKNEYLGVAQGELPSGLPENTEVAISLLIDTSGIIYVTARLPARPEVKVEAEIKWIEGQATTQFAQSMPAGPSIPKDWREEAQAILNWATLTLERGRRYLDLAATSRIQGLMTELQQAIISNQEALGRRKAEELQQTISNLGFVTLLVFAEALAGTPNVTPAEGTKLLGLVRQVQDDLAARNEMLLRSHLNDLNNLVSEILGRGQPAGQSTGGTTDIMRGLLRGSGSN